MLKRPPIAALLFVLLCTVPMLSVGGQFGIEFAIDAPWRLEPVVVNGAPAYGPIPIVVAFYDAVFEKTRPRVSSFTNLSPIDVGRFVEVRVIEWTQDQPHPRHPVTVLSSRDLREIHRKQLVSTKSAEPNHDICRPGPTQDCEALLQIGNTHEWHAAFWYTPRGAVTPGRNIHLEVIAVTERGGQFFRTEWRNFLVVHAAARPLPRFADDWLYGDFHYHSQMTDNEGESGYSYRNVARALGAMGMDFVFATDHASNGVQIDGGIPSQFCADAVGPNCKEARDLNAFRYIAAKSLLYGPDGANVAIERDADTRGLARLRAARTLPQIYLGEEIDAIPEITRQEFDAGSLTFGDGLRYAWPDSNGCIAEKGLSFCQKKYSRPEGDSFVLYDEQGIPVEETALDERGRVPPEVVKYFTPDLTEAHPSRQHLVYFPTSIAQTIEGWIGSDTGPYGGGGKRLQDVLREIEGRGVAFLAHPLSDSRPGGPAGPDIVPYSDLELRQAWASSAVLGLQFWNENDRYRSFPDRRTPTVMFSGALEDEPRTMRYSYNWPFQAHETGNFPWFWQHPAGLSLDTDLYHGAYTWDRYLRLGLDPAQLTALRSWLPPGEPRKWFMASGSDSHGDFNFRRHGRPGFDRWTDVPVSDTAIGNPRNLVSMSQSPAEATAFERDPSTASNGVRRYANTAVIASLQAGRFSVTDGPAIRIAIDTNLNNVIDNGDVQMGSTFDYYPGDRIPVLVEWLSTSEFGPVARVDLYVGNERVTFAPSGHGPARPREGGRNAEYGNYQPDPGKVLQVSLLDAYGRLNRNDPSLANVNYHGVARVYLGPGQFQLAQRDQALSYVRAYAVTVRPDQAENLGVCPAGGTAGNRCGNRHAYSNPVWSRFNTSCPATPRPTRPAETALGRGRAPRFVDSNTNNVADTCEDQLRNVCAVSVRDQPVGELPTRVSRGTDARGPNRPQARPIPMTSCQRLSARPAQ
jgi:hypothetical protein